MSPAASILARCDLAGVALEARGDRLRFDARHGLPDDLRRDLVEHKAEVLALLRLEDSSAPTAPLWEALAGERWGPSLDHDLPALDVGRDGPIRPL